MRLVERDFVVLREVFRFKCCLGRHLKQLANFSSQRTADRRLKLLVDNGYLERKRILYGIPAIYSLTAKSKKLLNYGLHKDSIRVEHIIHDITVLDTVIYFLGNYPITLSDIQSEKELHQNDGFGVRFHRPDFVFQNGKCYCVEVELNLKSTVRFEQNIKINFQNYDVQIWVVDDEKPKIRSFLEKKSIESPNIEVINLKEIKEYARNL